MKSNKKRIIIVFAILTMALVLSFVFVACGNDTNKTGTEKTADYKVTIHPNNGQSDIVWDITKAIPTITKDGYHIAGCFLDAQLTTSTTLESLKTTELTKNIDVYVKWEEHVEATDAAVEPTCTKKGLTEGKHCSKCGKILTAQTEIDALGHDLENHAGQPATCTEKGWEEYVTCKRDGCTYTTYQEIAALDHDLEHHAGQTATCTEKGWEAYDTCKRDGCTYTTYKEIAALGHTGGTATCTEQATCERCNKKYGSALGHKYGDLISKIEPTCSAAGTEAHYKCSACNKVFKDDENKTETTLDDLTIAINPNAHNFGEWIKNEGTDTHTRVCSFNNEHTETENCHGGTATCTEQAVCERCNEKYGNALGHKYGKLIPQTNATCSATGTKAHYKCSSCNKLFANDEHKTEITETDLIIPIDENAHDFGKWIKNEGADTHTRVCSFNSEHTETENCHGGTATCTEQATCEKCNAKYGVLAKHDFKDNVCVVCGIRRISEGLEYSLNSDETGYAVTGIGTCTDTEIVIPSIYNSKPVTNIKPSAFENCSGLTSITIGNGMMNIGKGAFFGCSELVNIYYAGDIAKWCGISGLGNIMLDSRTLYIGGNKVAGNLIIPDSVTSIGDYAFWGCTGLTSITIPDSVTSIGERAFRNCTGLSSITIPDSVTSIGFGAFRGCTGLTSITIPDSVTSIGELAFERCTGLTSVTIGNSVTSIGYGAFYGCIKLVEVYNKSTLSITAGSSDNGYVAYNAKNVFTNEGGSKLSKDENGYVIYTDEYEQSLVAYTGTETELTLPAYITQIYKYAFTGCSGLTSITIPDSVTSVGYAAFSGCTGLTSVTIGGSVTSIDGSAFSGCTGLTSITIPNGVTSISDSAFSGCTGLTSIIVNERNTNYHSAGNCLIETATETLILGCKTSVIPTDGSVTSIGEYAFYKCTGLTSVTIPDSVTSIGRYAFMNCTGLTNITIPDSVTSIGDRAFYDTTWYNNQPDGLVYAGKVAYKYKGTMPNNTSIVLKEGTLGIADFAFQGCSGLTSITIPDSVTSVGYAAFSGCTGLIKIIGPSDAVSAVAKQCDSKAIAEIVITSGTSISDSAFRDCTSLTTVTIPDSVTSIDGSAFSGCKGLTSVTIGNGVTSIGDSAFRDCTSLTTVTIPDSVTSIDGSAFSGCTGLTSITIPDSVTSIGFAAFFGCTGLTSVTIGNGVTSIGDNAFWGCNGLTSITIPDSVTSIGSSAFYNCTGLTSISGSATNVGTVAKQAKPTSFTVNITSGTSIGDRAFSGCTGLTSVTMGNSVTSIRGGAFYGCTGLTSITIPDSVTHIDDYAFEDCTGLTSITIPDSVTSIGNAAFYNTAWYNNQPDGLVYVGKVAYKYKGTMPSNTSIVLEEGTLSITDHAFEDCTGLTSVTIPDSVTSIGSFAFSGCAGLTSITFNGTIAQWNAIYKGYDWKLNVPATQVVCTDGTTSI